MIKILIVDDESTIRLGLMALIKKAGYAEVIACKNGQEALEVALQFRPQVVFTDIRMPVMDGLTLIKKCQELHLNSKFIIISGYGEFEYARTALQLQAFDYILKPVDHQKLITLLNRLTVASENETRERQSLKTQIASLCLQNSRDETGILPELLAKAQLQFKAPQVVVLHLKLPGDTPADFQAGMMETVNAILAEELNHDYLTLRYEEFLILILDQTEITRAPLPSYLNKILEQLGRDFKMSATVGVGETVPDLSAISESYHQALAALSETIHEPNQKLFFFRPERQSRDSIALYYEKEKELFLHALADRQPEPIAAIIDGFFQKALQQKYPPLVIFHFCREVKDALSKIPSSSGEISRPPDSYVQFISDLALGNLPVGLKKEVGRALEQLAAGQIKQYGHIVDDIIKYLRLHYQEELLIEKVCARFYINVSYFCKLFKSKTGVSFHQYLTELRIRKAKELLKYEHYHISEVAALVGYNNAKHFAKVFKEIAGVTPTEFKNMPNLPG